MFKWIDPVIASLVIVLLILISIVVFTTFNLDTKRWNWQDEDHRCVTYEYADASLFHKDHTTLATYCKE